MIRPDRHENALRALNAVLIVARQMACERASHEQLAAVLDAAEELPTLFTQVDDRTAYFREVLTDLTARHAGFGLAVQRFDGEA